MADYIDKNILCQAYMHVESNELSQRELSALLAELKQVALSRSQFFLYSDIEVEVTHGEGSLKTYITVLGVITPLFVAVANYPSFREGAIAIYDDASRLSDYLVSESMFNAKARHEDIIRTEARIGVIGSLRKIISDIDKIRAGNGVRSQAWLGSKLADVREDVERLLENVKSEEDRRRVRKGLKGMAVLLPVTPAPSRRHPRSQKEELAYQTVRRRLLDVLEARESAR